MLKLVVFVSVFVVLNAYIANFNPNQRSSCNGQCQNEQPSCPCKKQRNSTDCFVYDTATFATSLNEALYTFPDVSDPSINRSTMMKRPAPKAAPAVMSVMSTMSAAVPEAASQPDFSCASNECQACMRHVMDGFATALKVSPTSGASANGTNCTYIRQKEVEKANAPKFRGGDSVAEQILNILDSSGGSLNRQSRDTSDNSVDSESSVDETDIKDKLLGVSTEISCDYMRGETLASGSNWCGLCNLCWTWRKLPSDYFPSYLNEVSCSSNNACLAGFGKCRPVLRTLTVLRNAGTATNEQWMQQSINSVAGCECQVEAGTSLHAFITR
uniref:DUF4773 domain-containing protein n=1 Tax=Panagrellus redivivus TaxID=6233 RepID=A0A7E4VNJ9_PANRE